MTTKEVLESAAHVAEVLIALVAVSPFIARAIYLIRTEPPMTANEHHERIKLRLRMKWGQLAWTSFLTWVRRQRNEILTWREWRYRTIWCPIGGHSGEPKPWGAGGGFQLWCEDCRAWGTGDTMESVRRWQREGSEPWEASKYRQRADPKTAEIVAEVVKQLAGALGGPHGG